MAWMDIHKRRSILKCRENPELKVEYLVFFSGNLMLEGQVYYDVQLTYVPDRVVLDGSCLQSYLSIVEEVKEATPEVAGRVILEDTNNELVPKWIRVSILGHIGQNEGPTYRCLFQDRQPNWSNPELISAVTEIGAS